MILAMGEYFAIPAEIAADCNKNVFFGIGWVNAVELANLNNAGWLLRWAVVFSGFQWFPVLSGAFRCFEWFAMVYALGAGGLFLPASGFWSGGFRFRFRRNGVKWSLPIRYGSKHSGVYTMAQMEGKVAIRPAGRQSLLRGRG